MIPFRYHLFSLAAVFFALGVGIFLGGTVGQTWIALGEKEMLSKLEIKYNRAMKSNSELREQIDRLVAEVERSNEEVFHFMAARYADDLQGGRLYVWHPKGDRIEPVAKMMDTVGVTVLPYQEGVTKLDGPLLVLSRERPQWMNGLPKTIRFLQLDHIPDSPSKQWALLEQLRNLMTEMRIEREKS